LLTPCTMVPYNPRKNTQAATLRWNSCSYSSGSHLSGKHAHCRSTLVAVGHEVTAWYPRTILRACWAHMRTLGYAGRCVWRVKRNGVQAANFLDDQVSLQQLCHHAGNFVLPTHQPDICIEGEGPEVCQDRIQVRFSWLSCADPNALAPTNLGKQNITTSFDVSLTKYQCITVFTENTSSKRVLRNQCSPRCGKLADAI
jgi:hypothetical protein